jgi:hypothetical protein
VSASAAASTWDRPLGFFGDDGCADRDLFGIGPFPARLQNTEHFIADAQIRDAFAHRADHAGEIAAQHQGKRRLAVVAGAHFQSAPLTLAANASTTTCPAAASDRKLAAFHHPPVRRIVRCKQPSWLCRSLCNATGVGEESARMPGLLPRHCRDYQGIGVKRARLAGHAACIVVRGARRIQGYDVSNIGSNEPATCTS